MATSRVCNLHCPVEPILIHSLGASQISLRVPLACVTHHLPHSVRHERNHLQYGSPPHSHALGNITRIKTNPPLELSSSLPVVIFHIPSFTPRFLMQCTNIIQFVLYVLPESKLHIACLRIYHIWNIARWSSAHPLHNIHHRQVRISRFPTSSSFSSHVFRSATWFTFALIPLLVLFTHAVNWLLAHQLIFTSSTNYSTHAPTHITTFRYISYRSFILTFRTTCYVYDFFILLWPLRQVEVVFKNTFILSMSKPDKKRQLSDHHQRVSSRTALLFPHYSCSTSIGLFTRCLAGWWNDNRDVYVACTFTSI